MSGGVDSSVAAALLVEQGYDVTGAYMINYDSKDDGQFTGPGSTTLRPVNKSCWVPDYRDAVRVAAKLGIPLLKLNFVKEYRQTVLKYMYDEYKKGRTPNPDVMCNRWVKFGFWLKKARELGFDKIATGHYTKVVESRKGKVESYELLQAKDANKDQTYFLHQLNQGQLSHALFPLGKYTKDQVRRLAKKFDLPTANKEESMGICFVGEVNMKDFLQKEIKTKPGKVVMSDGKVIGEHDGLAFYTIGERGLGLGSQKLEGEDNKPIYVVDKKYDINELVVGFEDDPLLFKNEIEVGDVNWIFGFVPEMPLKCEVRLRHRGQLQSAQVSKSNGQDKYLVKFEKKQRAITPGQFAVFYLDKKIFGFRKMKRCLGGGVIK